jgi:hypothetical protein
VGCNEGAPGGPGGRLDPLSEHLDALEEAVLYYLEASFYHNASRRTQLDMRKKGLTPMKPDAEMPEPYRLWKACERHNTLWWSGGISNQPYVMMREFAVCEIADRQFDEQLENYREILHG